MNVHRLEYSFDRVGQILARPRVARWAVFVLLVVHSCLLIYSAHAHSPTLNEPAHLAAGLSHWRFGRFELYQVNPPLVRMIAALPVILVGYEEDWSGFYEKTSTRPEFSIGEDFFAANKQRSFFLTTIARWACIPLSCIGGLVCYLWGRDLYGEGAGVTACLIWSFEPNILAHASLITPDAHAAAIGLAACYTYWRWLKKPTWKQAALTGVILGIAELAKTTLILFYPLWPLAWLIYRWQDRLSMNWKNWTLEACMLALRMVVGIYVMNLGYGFEESLKPLGEYHFVSNMLTGRSTHESRVLNDDTRPNNRFVNSFLGKLPVPLPENYLLGIDMQQRDFESYGRPSYLRGEWRNHGWWYYYIYAAAVKVPLGLLVIATLAVLRGVCRRTHPHPLAARQTSLRDSMLLLTPAVVIFTAVSSKTGFNEHFRYVLPAFPYIFIWLSGTISVSRSRTSISIQDNECNA